MKFLSSFLLFALTLNSVAYAVELIVCDKSFENLSREQVISRVFSGQKIPALSMTLASKNGRLVGDVYEGSREVSSNDVLVRLNELYFSGTSQDGQPGLYKVSPFPCVKGKSNVEAIRLAHGRSRSSKKTYVKCHCLSEVE